MIGGNKKLLDFSAYIIDIEGVIIKGNKKICKADEIIRKLKGEGKKVYFLSNITDKTRYQIAKELKKKGFNIEQEEIMTAAFATILYIKENFPKLQKCLLIGQKAFRDEIIANGYVITNNFREAEATIIGLDRKLNYSKINNAYKAIINGSNFIVANLSTVKLKTNDYSVGVGFTAKGLEYVTKKQPVVIGKPSKQMFEHAIKFLEVPREEILCIGDKLYEDILGGINCKLKTCLVLSGATKEEDISKITNRIHPDYVINSIYDMVENPL